MRVSVEKEVGTRSGRRQVRLDLRLMEEEGHHMPRGRGESLMESCLLDFSTGAS